MVSGRRPGNDKCQPFLPGLFPYPVDHHAQWGDSTDSLLPELRARGARPAEIRVASARGGNKGISEIEGIEQTIHELETDAIEIEKTVIALLRAVELIHKSRAAGALLGVALDRQLRTLSDRYSLEYQKEDSIEVLLQRLYENDAIVLTQLGTIRYIAGIGGRCGHAGNVTSNEVRASIDRLKELIRQSLPTASIRSEDTLAEQTRDSHPSVIAKPGYSHPGSMAALALAGSQEIRHARENRGPSRRTHQDQQKKTCPGGAP